MAQRCGNECFVFFSTRTSSPVPPQVFVRQRRRAGFPVGGHSSTQRPRRQLQRLPSLRPPSMDRAAVKPTANDDDLRRRHFFVIGAVGVRRHDWRCQRRRRRRRHPRRSVTFGVVSSAAEQQRQLHFCRRRSVVALARQHSTEKIRSAIGS